MTFPVAHGWSARLGVVAPKQGKLVVGIESFTVKNQWPSYPGFNGYSNGGTEFLADSTRTQAAIIEWLTGKASGATILALVDGIASREYGSEWQACVSGLGHTVTTSGHTTGFGGYDPLDFDMLAMGATLSGEVYRGMTLPQSKVDYILANRGAILGTTAWGTTVWEPYGFDSPYPHTHPDFPSSGGQYLSIHADTYGPFGGNNQGWREQMPFNCTEFGDPGEGGSWSTHYYAYTRPTTTVDLHVGTNTRGGSNEFCYCELPDDATEYEDHYRSSGHTVALGLWWL